MSQYPPNNLFQIYLEKKLKKQRQVYRYISFSLILNSILLRCYVNDIDIIEIKKNLKKNIFWQAFHTYYA